MFDLFDIITIGAILILLFFFIILFVIEKSLAKPRVYLKTVLLLALFTLLLDELIYLKQYDLVLWLYPLIIGALFSVYPLIYLYSRDLVLNGKDDAHPGLFKILVLPIIIFILTSILYYPLDYNSKIKFIEFYYVEDSSDLTEFKLFQYFIIPAYYIQTTFYMIISLKLISVVKRSISSNPWELLLVRYISGYVIIVIIYESLLILNAILMIDNMVILRTIEMLLTLLFISAGLYIAFKQSLVLLQAKLSRYADKLEFHDDKLPVKSALLDSERQEIKEAIEHYFHDTKIYIDPNLKLENLSRKIHIPVKKISSVINEIYGKNFISFINDFRILEAKKIMSGNYHDIKIDSIYMKAGFNSRSTFNRVFKSVTGTTPAEYIANMSGNNQNGSDLK